MAAMEHPEFQRASSASSGQLQTGKLKGQPPLLPNRRHDTKENTEIHRFQSTQSAGLQSYGSLRSSASLLFSPPSRRESDALLPHADDAGEDFLASNDRVPPKFVWHPRCAWMVIMMMMPSVAALSTSVSAVHTLPVGTHSACRPLAVTLQASKQSICMQASQQSICIHASQQ